MTNGATVYLIDDDASLRNSIRFLLASHGRDVIGFPTGEAFLDRQPGLEPGPILLDVQMTGMDGLMVQRLLLRQGCTWPVIILTGHGNIAMAVRAIKSGAVDFLTKPFARADLLAVLEQADARLADQDAMHNQQEVARHRLCALTVREQQVLNELARGLPNKTIAYDLGISSRTVEIYRANLMRKLGVQSFPDALRIAFAAGMPFAAGKREVAVAWSALG
ncbi:MAG TPA: response regulator [Novosphingobium sp.]|nr:response regulator [Novosphingobium sp.]HZV10004.1 response regulator [Novosphingobium sp.]